MKPPSLQQEFQIPIRTPYQIAKFQGTIIYQLRLRIIGLNEDLHKLGHHENGHCDHRPELETVHHFLIMSQVHYSELLPLPSVNELNVSN